LHIDTQTEAGENVSVHFTGLLAHWFENVIQDNILFGMVFLSRILEKAFVESGQNSVAHFLVGELLDSFAYILQCFHDGDKMEHADPLPLFSNLLKEEYLWSEEYDEEEDEMRYEEDDVFPADLFYSLYYYSWQAVLAYRSALQQEVFPEFAPKMGAVLAEL